MRIRPVEHDDFESIASLTNRYIRDTVIHFGEKEITAQELREEWRRLGPRYPFLVACGDGGTDRGSGDDADSRPERGRFLGYAKSGPWRTRAAYRNTVEIGIYMMPEAQGKGLGRRLYQALIDACMAKGFHAIIGGVTMPNEISVRLHEGLGFKPIGVFPQVGYKFDRWHDVGFWQLTVPSAAPREA